MQIAISRALEVAGRMLLMLGVLPAQVSSFGAVGGALGSGCAAGEVRPKIGLAAARM